MAGKPSIRVCPDPGHGGTDPGAIGASGTPEKQYNLQVALLVREALQSLEYAVVMTQENDTTVALPDRVPVATGFGAKAFVPSGPDSIRSELQELLHRQPGFSNDGSHRALRKLSGMMRHSRAALGEGISPDLVAPSRHAVELKSGRSQLPDHVPISKTRENTHQSTATGATTSPRPENTF